MMAGLGGGTSEGRINAFFREQSVLKALLKEFRDGVLICDSRMRIVQMNRSLKRLFKLDDQVLGKPVSDILTDRVFNTALRATIKNGQSQVSEMTWRGRTNKLFFETHLVPVWMPQRLSPGEPTAEPVETDTDEDAGVPLRTTPPDGCVVVFHNITDIRRTEKMRRDFVANVSHELRTPLTAITGYSETLLEGAMADPELCREFIGVIHRHSLRLSHLVGDLLDLSKLESPDYQPELTPVSLESLIHQAFLLVEDKAVDKGIHLSVDIPEPLPTVLAEPSSLQQVLTNLLDNAIKYTPAEGRVSISAKLAEPELANGTQVDLAADSPSPPKVQVAVTDNGIGIEAKYLSRIFQRFYRVDKARSRDLGGTGLGLSIVKHIVQLHGDEISVQSVVNEGSTFSFCLAVDG